MHKSTLTLQVIALLCGLTPAFAKPVPFKYPSISPAEFSEVLNSHPNRTAVVLGGGPGGLLSAIALHRFDPSLNIVVVEKRENYCRGNTLTLRLETFPTLTRMGLFERMQSALIFSPECHWCSKDRVSTTIVDDLFGDHLSSINYSTPIIEELRGRRFPHFATRIEDYAFCH